MLGLVTGAEPLTRLRAAPVAPAPAPPAPTGTSRAPLSWRVRRWWNNLRTGSALVPLWAHLARRLGLVVAYTELRLAVVRGDGTVTDLGCVSRRIVTTAGVNYLAGTLSGTGTITLFKYAGFGTGTTAAAVGDTALQTETSNYATASTRPTGSQSTSTNVYTTVATFSPGGSGTLAITEFGLFSQAATGGGTLLDHFVFSAVNLTQSSDSLQSTFTLTLPNGG